jgi:hypothetical protein
LPADHFARPESNPLDHDSSILAAEFGLQFGTCPTNPHGMDFAALKVMHFARNDPVAVMPLDANSPADVVRIARVSHASPAFIRTSDGRMYSTVDGADLYGTRCRYIVPATEEHRAALLGRTNHDE